MKNKTKKIPNLSKRKTIKNKYQHTRIVEKDGWKVIEIHGTPFERGRQHGSLLYKELEKTQMKFPTIVKNDYPDLSYNEYLEKTTTIIEPIMKRDFPELYRELEGIQAGAMEKGVVVSITFLISLNAFLCMEEYFYPLSSQRQPKKLGHCSAFIAVGEYTKTGEIVMAHNSHDYLVSGLLLNIVIRVYPDKGIPFTMQTGAGLIWSSTDWFITKAGIIGSETTIGDISYKPQFGAPCFCRIRQAMQYGKTLDDYVSLLLKDNAGDYANSWLFGDIQSGEIMRFEIGKKIHSVKRTKSGVYYGMNSAFDNELREKETEDDDFDDIKTSSGNRNRRLYYLLREKYVGEIDVSVAKKIIGDHYDVNLGKQQMNDNGICNHTELVAPYDLFGATDGKITTSSMARKMEFLGISGSACGKRRINTDSFFKKHPNQSLWKNVLEDMGPHTWTKL